MRKHKKGNENKQWEWHFDGFSQTGSLICHFLSVSFMIFISESFFIFISESFFIFISESFFIFLSVFFHLYFRVFFSRVSATL